MRKYQYQIYYHTSRGRYFIKMVNVETIRDDNEKRILRCSEGNRIWYQIWITQLDMNCIERYFDGYASNTRCQNFLVLKMCICLQGTP